VEVHGLDGDLKTDRSGSLHQHPAGAQDVGCGEDGGGFAETLFGGEDNPVEQGVITKSRHP